jgi:hypothetical protein
MYHKTRLYLLSCSDKSCMSFIKVYAKLREITNEGKKLGGKGGRDRAHSCIYDGYVSWCHSCMHVYVVYDVYVSLSLALFLLIHRELL